MEIKEMNLDEVEARRAEILVELDSEEADVEALSVEVDKLEERANEIRQQAEAKKEIRESRSWILPGH